MTSKKGPRSPGVADQMRLLQPLFTVLAFWVTDVTQGERRSQDGPTAAGLLSQKQFYVPSRWPL